MHSNPMDMYDPTTSSLPSLPTDRLRTRPALGIALIALSAILFLFALASSGTGGLGSRRAEASGIHACARRSDPCGTDRMHGIYPMNRLAAQSALPPDALVFVDFPSPGQSTDTGLFAIQPDGRNRQALAATAQGVRKSKPSLSPDRQSLAYSAYFADPTTPGTGRWLLGLWNVAAGAAETITEGPIDDAPDWHPSGRVIAYATFFGSGDQIDASALSVIEPFAVPRQSNPLTGILDDRVHRFGGPVWSPDGQRLAVPIGTTTGGGELYLLNADGTDLRRLFAHPGWDDIDPAWSPDGRRLAFAAGPYLTSTADTRHDIWLIDLASRVAGTIATHATYDLRRPSWSPDGNRLVFDAGIGSGASRRYELYTIAATGGPLQGPLTTGFDADWATGNVMPSPSPTPTQPPPTGSPMPTATYPVTGTRPSETSLPPLPTLPPLPALPTFPPPGEPTVPGPAPTFPPPATPTPPTHATPTSQPPPPSSSPTPSPRSTATPTIHPPSSTTPTTVTPRTSVTPTPPATAVPTLSGSIFMPIVYAGEPPTPTVPAETTVEATAEMTPTVVPTPTPALNHRSASIHVAKLRQRSASMQRIGLPLNRSAMSTAEPRLPGTSRRR